VYENLGIVAILLFFYSIIAGRVERTVITGPIVFVVLGFVLGPMVLGWFDSDLDSFEMRTIADLTLALILFIDAASAHLPTLKQHIKIPARMLAIGLPGVIGLGFLVCLLLFKQFSVYEAALLAVMLAATDAALGKAVITNKAVPIRIREGLNAESGLNDGLCVPLLLFFIALAQSAGASDEISAISLIARELGIGIAVGFGMATMAGWLIRYCYQEKWLSEVWTQVTVVALAISTFSIAQSLHGSGYIAAFVGGLQFGYLTKDATHKLVFAAEAAGESLAMITWFIFGALVLGQQIGYITWEVILYALMSLTVIRMLPIFVCLAGTGEPASHKLFLGWFGPRGLASIVFVIIVINSGIPAAGSLASVVIVTVFLSLIAHGISASPLANWLARR
jgi:NhaP-type Na+/H+ or K+/H+ antiporter